MANPICKGASITFVPIEIRGKIWTFICPGKNTSMLVGRPDRQPRDAAGNLMCAMACAANQRANQTATLCRVKGYFVCALVCALVCAKSFSIHTRSANQSPILEKAETMEKALLSSSF